MFVIGNVIEAVAMILDKVLSLYSVVILIAVLLSWVSPDPFNPIVQFLRAVTQPLFEWVRRRVPFAVVGMIDLSPILVILGIRLMQLAVVRSLLELGARLRY